MLSVKKMGQGGEDYYLNLTRYYVRRRRNSAPPGDGDEDEPGFGPDDFDGVPELPTEPAGQWMGRGCATLGLFGIVLPEELKPLMQGLHPFTGEALVQNAGAINRVPGWDFTFSMPKSVSVVWSQADESRRLQLESAGQRALRRTIEFMEDFLAFSRVGKGGYGYVRVKLIVAAFEHCTSRNQDPQLHTHCLVLNIAVDDNDDTRTLFSRPLYVNRDLIGAFYRAALAVELRAMGFRIRKHGTSFEIVGVRQTLIDAHSTRRQEILAHLHNSGRSGGAAAAIAALDTRKAKTDLPPREELFARWQELNNEYGFTNVDDIIFDPKRHRQGVAQQAIDTAIQRLSAERSHFTRTDLQEAVLQEAPALGLDPMQLLRTVVDVANGVSAVQTVTTSTLLDLGVHDGQQRFTTREVYDEEQALLGNARTLASRTGAVVPNLLVEWAVKDQMKAVQRRARKAGKKGAKRPQLTDEQRQAVDHGTQDTKKSGALRIIRGVAGSGKTDYALAVIKRALEDAGYNVFAVTPTAKAGRVLKREAGMDAQTATKALGDYELPWGCVLKHHLRQLKNAALGKRTYPVEKPAPIKLGPKDVLLLDEAGMMSTRGLGMMVAHVAESGATLILAGDEKQNPPVERGAPFLSLANRFGSVQLTEIQRHDQEWTRQMATHASKGEVKEALSILAEKNAISVSDSLDEAAQAMVERWRALGGVTNPAAVVALANTNDQTEALNSLFQQLRVREGALNPAHSIEIRDNDAHDGITYRNRVHVGDQVLFTRNNKRIGIDNGSMGIVVAMRPLINAIAVQLQTGETVQVPVKQFPHVRLGYAITNFKAQGDGFPHIVALLTEAQTSLPSFYVNVTRGKHSLSVFTTKSLWDPQKPIDQSPLLHVLSRQPDLRLASDLLDMSQATALDQATLPPLEIFRLPERSAEAGENSPPTVEASPDDDPSSATQDSPTSPAETEPQERPEPPMLPLPESGIAAPLSEVKELVRAAQQPSTTDRKDRRATGRTGTPANTSDDVYQPLIMPPAPRKKRRKKRRFWGRDNSWEDSLPDEQQPETDKHSNPKPSHDASTIEKGAAQAVQEQKSEAESVLIGDSRVLPDDFLIVSIPSVESWTPTILTPPTVTPIIPSDFLTTPILLPTARVMAGGIRPQAAKDRPLAPMPPLGIEISPAELRKRGVKERIVREARQRAIADISKRFNVPPDRIEIIDIDQWQETNERQITIWTRVTYRITTYGAGGLVNHADYPVLL